MGMMRIDPNSKNLICRNCLERTPQKNQSSVTKEPQEKSTKKEESMKEYFCKECKYNFSRAKHLTMKSCPYCGASNSLMIKGSTARIIADAAKMKGDFEFR